jgi:ABC-type Fe3+/spermidine/putrescine transport system ATPase subunit
VNSAVQPAKLSTSSPQAGREVEVRSLWKSYGQGTYVVRDVSFTLRRGEFLTLLGPSGSGKTTTLMMVAGFETPTRGEILVDGRDIASRPPERRNFGVVFQGYALFPQKTVLENVEFGLRMKGVPSADRRRRALDMLDKVGLAPFTARKPRELSGGQQQRVALARALVFEPDALLLDEPLSALDRKLRESLQNEIKELQKRFGISILFVTHDQDEAMMMSDRIAVMADGRIVQIGSPSDVYLHPATPFVASFLGETNLLPGIYRGADDGHAVVEFKDAGLGPGPGLGRARLPADGRNLTAGDAVVVSIRPERVRLLTHQAERTFAGVVADCTFMGRHTRYRIQALGQVLTVSVTEWSPASVLCAGTPVSAGWEAEDAQILSGPEGAPATPQEISR